MERNSRGKNQNKSLSDKIILYSGIGVAILTVIVIALLLYSKNISDNVKNSTMSLEQMSNIANKNKINEENTESVSTEIGKSVEDAENEIEESKTNSQNISNTINTNNTEKANNNLNTDAIKNNVPNAKNEESKANEQKQINQNIKETSANAETESEKKDLKFIKPVEGEIVKEFAKDNLIYSQTLEEWTTHLGIDIKAEKTTVVKASEAGVVKSIKNDPRYGLTIVIEHDEHYQTIYSNLLTSEFVVEGEKVEQGQSIGTVGNTAIFEIADEPHLHFEILKDSIEVNPEIYNIK